MFAQEADDDADMQRVVTLIDGFIEKGWRDNDVTPTELADDAEFLRRASLDLTGRIPSVMETREFLKDQSPQKRRQLIERFLDDPRYAIHFSHFWRDVLLPEVEADFNTRYLSPSFEAWLRKQLIENVSYQTMVRDLLSVNVSANSMYAYDTAEPIAFYAAKEIKPENLAAATSRMLLGVRIECAQCHDHPFDHWTRRDFWSYSAFFAGLEQSRPGPESLLAEIREFFGQRKVQIPDTNEFVEPAYLDGTSMDRGSVQSPRQALTNWIVADSNPYFARTAVNRLWGYFLGTGFVEPIDDFSDRNPPSHPELLDALAKEFVAHKYDMKFLIKAIMLSRAYQLSSEQTDSRQSEPRSFASMPIRGLSAEQLYDSLTLAIGKPEAFALQNPFLFSAGTPRTRFNEMFSSLGTNPTDRPTTILQSLALMNGEIIDEATQADKGALLGSVVDFPGFTTTDRVDAMFLAVLTRLPTDAERQKLESYIDSGGPREDGRQATADVFWALLNSSEFLYNH